MHYAQILIGILIGAMVGFIAAVLCYDRSTVVIDRRADTAQLDGVRLRMQETRRRYAGLSNPRASHAHD